MDNNNKYKIEFNKKNYEVIGCPFCNGKPEIKQESSEKYFINCTKYAHWAEQVGKYPKQVVDRWNGRKQ